MRRFTVLIIALCALVAGPVTAATTITTVMSDLDNPRGLAFGPEGALYVVEAGRGGNGPCMVLRGLSRCYGPTGGLTRLWRGVQERVVSDLPSYAGADGEATGPHDIAFLGRGSAYVTIGFGGNPALRTGFGPDGTLFGTLIPVAASSAWWVVADVSAHETAENPDGDVIDSNPYGVLAEAGARVVTDAGANALLRVAANGKIKTLATFPRVSPLPPPPASGHAVPTAVVIGPDGAYYVSQLTGVPFTDGAANIYRVSPDAAPGDEPTVYLAGFKTIIDLDFGPDGSLYVLQHASGGPFFPANSGKVIRVAPDDTRSDVVTGLTRPTSLLVDENGVLYHGF